MIPANSARTAPPRRPRSLRFSVPICLAGAAVLAAAVLAAMAGPASASAPVPAKPGVVDSATWHLRDTLTAGPDTARFRYGKTGDQKVMGDWNGSGTATVGVVRRAADGAHLQWLLRNSNSAGSAQINLTYGLAGDPNSPSAFDYPIVGDWDGNGTDTPGIVRVRSQTLTFMLRNSATSGPAQITFLYGRTGVPIVGDWDGNGTDTAGVVRDDNLDPGHQHWLLRNSNSAGSAQISFVYGRGGDVPVRGDWNGDGTDTAGVVRFVSAGQPAQWLLTNSNTSGSASLDFGYGPSDRPVVVWR